MTLTQCEGRSPTNTEPLVTQTGWPSLFCPFIFGGGSFLGLHPRHMEVPRLEVELEL